MMLPFSASALLAVLAALASCTDHGAAPVAAAVRSDDAVPVLLIDPVASVAGDASRITLRHGLGARASSALPDAVDPCVVRAGSEQRALLPTLRDGEAGLDLPADAKGDALVGLSVPATASSPALHAKAIVAAPAAGGAPLPAPAVAARFGLRAELTPLIDPSTLATGDHLPVRLAVDLGDARDVEVAVEHQAPGSALVTRTSARTGAQGVALVHIAGAGVYAVTARVAVGTLAGGHEPAVTSLTFTIGTGGKR